MEGLAQSMATAPQQSPQGLPSVEEVVQLLVQGVPPEELLQSGIPEQLIMEAIAIIEKQMVAQQAPNPQGEGLAHSMAGM